jgi:ElaB/YqjD/DUF883 family membrane-anchored ribosome-binding protein
MSNESLTRAFPATQQDISQLKKTATDAVADLTSTAAAHATKAQGQIRDLAGHVRDESSEQFDQVKEKFGNIAANAAEYVVQRPFTCIGVALLVGFVFGLSRRRRARA